MFLGMMKYDRQQKGPRVFLERHPSMRKHYACASVYIDHMMVVIHQLLRLLTRADGNSLVRRDLIERFGHTEMLGCFLFLLAHDGHADQARDHNRDITDAGKLFQHHQHPRGWADWQDIAETRRGSSGSTSPTKLPGKSTWQMRYRKAKPQASRVKVAPAANSSSVVTW